LEELRARSASTGIEDDSCTPPHEIARKRAELIVVAIGEAVLNGNVAPIHKAMDIQSLTKGRQAGPIRFGIAAPPPARHRQRRLLCGRSEGPSRRRAAEEREDIAPSHAVVFHSMISSAIAESVGGMTRPSVLAVLRLSTNSNRADCCTGRSPAFSPLRMRPA